MNYPRIGFRAGEYGHIYNNINFARHEAENLAEERQEPVDIIQTVNGVDQGTFQTVEPAPKLELVQ